jgi:hypothetical protein
VVREDVSMLTPEPPLQRLVDDVAGGVWPWRIPVPEPSLQLKSMLVAKALGLAASAIAARTRARTGNVSLSFIIDLQCL